jgi:SAM-dependent methyltransferase
MDRALLCRFLEVYPFQPATAVWRAPEVSELSRVPFPPGLGLDLGCGDGRLTRVLAEAVGELRLVGLDVDAQETAVAREEGSYERVHTCPADRIPEPAATFDFVLSVSVMEHIPNLEAVLQEVHRVLKPGGRLICTIPSVGFHALLRGPWLPGATREDYLRALDRRVAHLRYWTIDQWRDALAAAGLRLLEARPILSGPDIRRWETLSRITAGLLHLMSRGKAPIEIQRSLGLRKGHRLPASMAALAAGVLGLGLDATAPSNERDSGCLLVVAERGPSAQR